MQKSSNVPTKRKFKFTPNGAMKTALVPLLIWLGTDQHFQPWTGDLFTLWIMIGLMATSIDPPAMTAPQWVKISYEILSYLALNVGAARNALAIAEQQRGVKLLPSPQKQEIVMTTTTNNVTDNPTHDVLLEGIANLANALGYTSVDKFAPAISGLEPIIQEVEKYTSEHTNMDVVGLVAGAGSALTTISVFVTAIKKTHEMREGAEKPTGQQVTHEGPHV